MRAAEILNAGERVAILIGQGARGAAAEVEEVAVRLGAGVAKALNGRDVLPDDLPYVTGSIGLLGTKPSDEMMQGCDTLLMIGSGFPYSEWLPEPGQARGVQIDIDARMLGIRYPMEVNLVGDARDTLRALLPLLQEKADRSWADKLAGEIDRWWRILADQAEISAEPLNPLKVFHELSPRLPDDCIVTADSGSGTNWWARHLRFRRGMRGALSGTLATMGPALPYALAAKFVHPDRPVIAIEGDGSMQMNGINALIDVAKYRDRWSDPRFIVLVLNNQDLNQVTWEQRVLTGDPKLPASQTDPRLPVRALRRAARVRGHPRRRTRPGRRRVGAGAGRRPAGRLRGDRRSRGSSAAAPHRVRTGQEPRAGAGQGRPRAGQDHPPVAEGEGAGAAQPLSAGTWRSPSSGPQRTPAPELAAADASTTRAKAPNSRSASSACAGRCRSSAARASGSDTPAWPSHAP